MQKSDFDKLLQRYVSGEVSEQERIKIEAWLEVMKTEDNAQLELSKADEDRLFQKITASVSNVDEIIAITGKEKVHFTGWLMRIAAALLVVTAVSYSAWKILSTDTYRLQRNSAAGVEKVILNDGSLAWLRGKSSLVYYEKPAEGIRYAELTGEALFEVAKDARHPFVIRCGDATIRVVGTSFSIRTGNDSLELRVLTGKVSFSATTAEPGVDVEPNEKLVYLTHGIPKKFTMEEQEAPAITAGTEYNMQFANATLGEAMERIGKKFDVSITLSQEAIGKCRITADFTDRSLESTLQMIKEVLDVEYTKNGKTVMLTGGGCQ